MQISVPSLSFVAVLTLFLGVHPTPAPGLGCGSRLGVAGTDRGGGGWCFGAGGGVAHMASLRS